jgi:hypothetical protein
MAWPCINRAGYAPHLENTTFHAWGSLHAFKSKPLPVLMSTDEPCHFNLKLTTGKLLGIVLATRKGTNA